MQHKFSMFSRMAPGSYGGGMGGMDPEGDNPVQQVRAVASFTMNQCSR